jgi:hypothetical protein
MKKDTVRYKDKFDAARLRETIRFGGVDDAASKISNH